MDADGPWVGPAATSAPDGDDGVRRCRIRVDGVVQGVGFRPYVHGLASELGLDGFVGNDTNGVFAEVQGPPGRVDAFLTRLPAEAPRMAVVEQVATSDVPPRDESGFHIVTSAGDGVRDVAVSPDIATCDDCLAELWDPADRRYRYPFVNCTNCGPRYTIVRDVPYDRPSTTMAGFAMCDDCAREYSDPSDRRFHAQPVSCPACGPRLTLRAAADGEVPEAAARRDGGAGRGGTGLVPLDDDPIAGTADLLGRGRIVAIKGLGGYHLAVDATNEDAVARLRRRKHREERPLAVMVADLDAARALAHVDAHEAALLTGPAAPIVLLRRRADDAETGARPVARGDAEARARQPAWGDAETGARHLAPGIAPGNRHLGVMLPYTPLHHLLLAAVGRPIVLTSGNVSDEPIAHTDDDAVDRLGGIADAFHTHARAIHMRVDDSVVRRVGDRQLLIRRSRGYAPRPELLGRPVPRPVLAVGAELKSTICVAKGRRAYLSHHIGDLENYETFRSFTEAIEHLTRLFDVTPEIVAHDLHPEYLSANHARELDGVDLVGVQHHHAHIASCLADNGTSDRVIGVAFDGTGYGTDGTIWGGEILVADLVAAERVGHLEPVPLPGGAAAIREPWRMAAAWLQHAYGDAVPDGLDVVDRHTDRWRHVLAAAAAGVNAPPTSSIGRLFDAVAALAGVRDRVTYEGQAAIELEQRAGPAVASGAVGPGAIGSGAVDSRAVDSGAVEDGYPLRLSDGAPFTIVAADLIRGVADDLLAGAPVARIAARFHAGVVAGIVAACRRVRDATGLSTVALSGGVFQNVLLVRATVAALGADGFAVLTHDRVPPNDAGISFGQVAVAAARDLAAS